LDHLPHAVRKGVDFRTAVKYETLLRNCGCVCRIEIEPYEVEAGPAAFAAPPPPPAADAGIGQGSGARTWLNLAAVSGRLATGVRALRSPGTIRLAAAAGAPLVLGC